MSNIKEIEYTGRNHGSFEQEWLSHKKASEWWYATGFLNDEAGAMYSYQYTVLKAVIPMMTPWIVHLALTDFTTGKHYYSKKVEMNSKKITIDDTAVNYSDVASLAKEEKGMRIKCEADDFSYDLFLDYGKGAFWHCDNGYLLMGKPETNESTIYYSYPNMPTKGTITINGKALSVTGKSWFDKQGGPYRLIEGDTHWEWFSLRFFDDEEIMLFSFPQNNYQDGTYIKGDSAQRLTDYTITPDKMIEVEGLKFSCGWKLFAPGIKEETYTITPFIEGQMQNMYFEQLCEVKNSAGEKVGLCFVELLPGVYNKKFISALTT
jgi:predicted secreted hydrolase